MKSHPYVPSMVQAITVLTVLKMMTKAQTSCGAGGKIMYERLPNIQLQGFDDDIVRDTAPPFMVLEKCEDLCLRDRASNNLVRPCRSFDFQPGSRIANYNGGNGADYEESTCYLTAEQARPEGLGTLMLVPNSVHFTEVCIASTRPDRECPNRRYVFERHPRKRLKLPNVDTKEITASNRTECEDLCLNEFNFICRSATFDSNMRTCILSRFTRRTHPELLQDDPDSDYLENTCLAPDRRCDGLAVFIKEENKRLGGPFEVDMYVNISLEDCQAMCVRAEKYLCRSIEYDDMTKMCTLSEEDSISQKDDIDISSSPTHHFYDFACLDSPRGSEYPDTSASSHLYTGKRPDTAFQRYRNSRLGGEHHSEISGRSLSECLDECLRQPSFQCKSAEYSERYRTCRLTRYNQKDGMRIIYDADYDYYENLMLGGDDNERPPPDRDGFRPGGGRFPPGRPPSRFPPSGNGGGGGRFPPGEGSRFPSSEGGRFPPSEGGRYPPGESGRYPPPGDVGRYPPPPARYPPNRGYDEEYGGRYPPPPPHRYPYDRNPNYHYDRYPPRYPPRPTGPDRYPPTGPDRYPPSGGARYPPPAPPPPSRERYPPPRPPYPGGDRYDDRYDDRHSGGRYGGGGYDRDHRYGYRNRYDDRFRRPDDDRYDDRYEYEDPSGRWYGRPRPRPPPPPSRPYHDRDRLPYDVGAPTGNRRPISPGPDGPIYDNYPEPPPPPGRPVSLRCEDAESFRQVAPRLRARKEFIRRYVPASSLLQCQRECVDTRDFVCRSFNYREPQSPYDAERDNCEISDRDTREMEVDNPAYFENTGGYDFYERSMGRQSVDDDCLDVSQVCNEDGMEFTLRTPEGFYGRIYTYGNYDRCFFRGNGGTVNVLRISGAQAYPECGTQRYGDTMTNIVVVQFSDYVQTGKDKRFNLTCLFRGPGESVVSSGFIGAGTGSPIPIEYLPAENTLSSKVRLMILYQGRPTTTIAVGDPLTFKLEALDGSYYPNEIFATNVVARDPYSGRSIQLIDRFGCPVDPFVFPELGKGRSGDTLEARFNAFKIPESNFLVFEATVRTCRDGCQPAYCPTGSGRAETSYGKRRRRDVNATLTLDNNNSTNLTQTNDTVTNDTTVVTTKKDEEQEEYPEYVREMIEVFESREELQQEARRAVPAPETVCLTKGEYHTLVSAVMALVAILLTVALITGFAYRRYWSVMRKNLAADRATTASNLSSSYPNTRSSPISGFSIFGNTLQKPFPGLGRSARNFPSLTRGDDLECSIPAPGGPFEDPSEPIYTDPSLFERSRSLRSISVTQKRRREQQD